MGCVSSKIMRKSLSFREELNRSLKRRANGFEEIIVSKNGGDQFVAILCAANTVARRIKEDPPTQDPNLNKNTNPISIISEDPSIETINTWELLAGLEEEQEEEESEEGPGIASRSFCTVEEGSEISIKECIKQEGSISERNLSSEKGSRRKAMAKGLTALKVPGFEFSRTGSLREWLMLGGQVFSPGSYVTPKFGNLASPEADNGDNTDVFDPELVAHFEEAMKQLTEEEEFILKEIIESLEMDQSSNEEIIVTPPS